MIQRHDKEDNLYARLHVQALEMIQELSGNRWTDFNAHDPGVTILEAVHYALLDLQLALEQPFESFLTENGKLCYGKFGLFPAKELTAPSLVTPADYEQSIRAGVKGVKRCRVSLAPDCRYRIEIEPERNADRGLLKKQISEHYHARRNFCETLGETVFKKIDGDEEDNDDILPIAPEFAVKNTASERLEASTQAYYSFQNHFPDTYGVNEKGVPAGVTSERKALIRQLKAYLLIFDFMMSNVLHQSRTVARLMDLSERTPPPYVPDFLIDDMENLIDEARFAENGLLDVENRHRQKSLWIDLIYAMYGEDAKTFFADESTLTVQNEKRERLICRIPKWNAHRFRSFNILQTGRHNTPPVEQLAAAVFGQTAVRVYWVEHILLDDSADDCNKLTVAIYSTADDDSRKRYELFLRARLPVHVDVRFLWLSTEQHNVFWQRYAAWRQSLSEQNGPWMAACADKLREELKK